MTNFMNPHPMRQPIPMNMPQRQPMMQQQPMYYDQYGNPVSNQQVMSQQPMMQQPMYNNQQPMMQQPMYNNQQPMMQQPNVMVDQYGRVMPMQQSMINPNQQYIPNVPAQPNRFGDPSAATAKLTSSTVMQEDTGNRYQVPQAQQLVESKQMSNTLPMSVDFTVKAKREPLSTLNDKVIVTTITEPIKETQLTILEDGSLGDSLQEVIETIIEHAYLDENKSIIKAQTAIICNKHYNCTVQETVTEFFSMDIKSLYKAFKPAYSELKNKYDINLFNDIDAMITNRINDFLAININKELNIGSFATDFNELLKHLRNTTESMEDDLCDHMDSYLQLLVSNRLNLDETIPNCVTLAQEYSLVYLDKLETELGLDEIDNYTVKLSNSPLNNFIKSLAECAFNSFERNRFNVVTIDRKVYEFISNINNEIYCTRVI